MVYKKVDISIIVCCYSGNASIKSCLQSLLNQKRDSIYIEIILVDDGSVDGTSDKIHTFLENNNELRDIEFNYYRKVNGGLSIARNFGLKKAKSRIIAYVDEDAIVDRNFSDNIIAIFNKHAKVNCIGGKVLLLNDTSSFANFIQNSIFSFQMKSNIAVIGTNMAFRKKILESAGGFQPEFTYRGDESALFVKAKNIINIFKSDKVIVHHPQPDTLVLWLKTRYENGYFGAAIYNLDKIARFIKLKRLLISIIQLFTPLFLFIFIMFTQLKLLFILSIILYLLFQFKRFIYSKIIYNYIKEYHLNVSRFNLFDDLYIIVFAIIGFIYEDFGYLKGFFKYNNTKWEQNVL